MPAHHARPTNTTGLTWESFERLDTPEPETAARVEPDPQKVADLLGELVCDAFFVGYTFSTSFSLEFDRSVSGPPADPRLPSQLRLDLLGEWWIDADEEWNTQFPVLVSNDVPGEALQALKLTSLRWYAEPAVCSVRLEDQVLELRFTNGWRINISSAPVMGYTWVLHGAESPQTWAITCEGGEYFITDL
ncbi:MAG: hypothetical protein FWE61_01740 [Micrococcales bacterium]|nr:hypothetical protein [Micrococcales bacterium]